MDAIEMIKKRRSVRKYHDKNVDREIMKEFIELSSRAPSQANFQVARYTLIDNATMVNTLAKKALQGYAKNIEKLKNV